MPLHLCLIFAQCELVEKIQEKIILQFPKGYFILYYVTTPTYLSLYHLKIKYINVFHKCSGLGLVAHTFINLYWRSSFVLKLKKLNKGIDMNFQEQSKLMLWFSDPKELHLKLASGQKCRNFYQGQFGIYQLV